MEMQETSHRLDLASQLLKNKLQVFLIDYRGFKSEGRPSEKGLYMDGVAAYDHLVRKEGVLPRNIVLHGHSIGAAVAVEVALKRGGRIVILESAFTSTRYGEDHAPFPILSPLFPAHYANLQKISHLRVPQLIIHGEVDQIVPFSMGEGSSMLRKSLSIFFALKMQATTIPTWSAERAISTSSPLLPRIQKSDSGILHTRLKAENPDPLC